MTQTYCVQDLFLLVDTSTHPPKPSIPSIRAYWRALIRWIQNQLIFDRKILIPGFGFISSILIQDTKSFVLQILTTFLNQNYIQHKQEYQQYTKPVVSLHYTAISKMLEKGEEPEWLSKTLDRLFASVLNLIITENTTIDLGVLGKLVVHDKSLVFEPFVTHKKRTEHRTTVSKLIVNKENSFRIKNKSIFHDNICQNLEYSTNNIKLPLLNQSSIYNKYQPSKYSKTTPFSPKINSLPRNLNPNFTKHLDMLGEIYDPLSKDENYSDLIQSPETLLKTNFVKSTFCKPRYPPVIDSFVRTLSAPINNLKYNLSISGRIGCNYNISARSLYFDLTSRCIKNYIHIEGIRFKAQPSLLQETATDDQQLLYLTSGREELKGKVEARRKCYQRYNEYIQKQIPFELVNSIDNSQIKRILEKAGVNTSIAKDQTMEDIINKDLETIVKDYYYSGRKAILDYTLKDKEQRQRIGIVEILHQYPSWGQTIHPPITFSEFSRKYIGYSKAHISQHLLLSSCCLKIKHQWKLYGNDYFVDLPSKISSTNLLYFLKKQQQKILSLRTILRQKWRQSIILLVKQELKTLKHKHQIISLQRSVNILMSNLLRQLIQTSLYKYVSFFQQFKKEKYYTLEEIMGDEDIVENTFISVKIKDEGNGIVFAENLNDHVKVELLGLLRQIVEESKEFPSASVKNSFLWEVREDDRVYLSCYEKIEKIIDHNIEEVKKAIMVYKQYQCLLYQQSIIQQWCSSQHHTIQQYLSLLSQNRTLYSKIMNTLPFTIRMNMILVDGTDLKKKFLLILTEVQQQLYLSIYSNIKFYYTELKSRIQSLKSSMQLKVDSTSKLLEIEEKMYKIKKADIPETKEAFNQLKRWVNLLFSQGSSLLMESDLMEIYLINKNIGSLTELLAVEEQRVLVEKEQLERQLRREQIDFLDKIQKFQKQLISTLKQFTIRKQAQYYNKLLKQFIFKQTQHLHTRQTINIKQQHLGWGITKFTQLQRIGKILESPTQFWNLIMVIDGQLKQWGIQSIKNLTPDEIEEIINKNITDLKRIYYNEIDNQYLPNLIYNRINNELLDLKQKYLPLIKIFANKGLKQRHWELFSKEFTICQNKQSLTLNKVIGYKMVDEEDKIDILIEISETASKEFVIEKSKTRMMEEWYPISISLKQYSDTGINIIGSNIDPITDLLASQLAKTKHMRQLQEAKIFDQSLIEWELWLRFTQSLFVEWMKVQNSWCYLYPLYMDQDVVKNFPLEHAEFESITNSWKSIIRRVQEQPRVMEFTKNKKMLDVFLENNMKLSVMQNTITTFLEERDGKKAGEQEVKKQI